MGRAGPAMPLLLTLLSGCLLCFPDKMVRADPPLAAGSPYIDMRAPDSLNSKAEADLANIKQKRRMFGFTPRWLQNQLKEQAATSNKRSKENVIPLWMSNKLRREDNFRECLLVYLVSTVEMMMHQIQDACENNENSQFCHQTKEEIGRRVMTNVNICWEATATTSTSSWEGHNILRTSTG